MCEPATVSLIIAGISTAVAAGGAIAGGIAQQNVAEDNAKKATAAAAFEETSHRDKAKRLLAAQRVGYAKAGVDLSGTPLDVLADTAQQMEIDALAIRWGGGQEAAKYRALGQQGLMEGGIGAGDALLTGVSSWDRLAGGSVSGPGTVRINGVDYKPAG